LAKEKLIGDAAATINYFRLEQPRNPGVRISALAHDFMTNSNINFLPQLS
jgi:hypothetical protein